MPGRVYTPREFQALLDEHAAMLSPRAEALSEEVSEAILMAARLRAPGRLKAATVKHRTLDGYVVGVDEAMAGDAKFVMYGTGIYGEMHRVIRTELHRGMPITTAGGTAMFRKSQKGTPKNRFFEDAVDEVRTTLHERTRRLGDDVVHLER